MHGFHLEDPATFIAVQLSISMYYKWVQKSDPVTVDGKNPAITSSDR